MEKKKRKPQKQVSYYRSQLNRIERNPDLWDVSYAAQIKVKNGNGSTNWLDLNTGSAQELANWIRDEFNIIAD